MDTPINTDNSDKMLEGNNTDDDHSSKTTAAVIENSFQSEESEWLAFQDCDSSRIEEIITKNELGNSRENVSDSTKNEVHTNEANNVDDQPKSDNEFSNFTSFDDRTFANENEFGKGEDEFDDFDDFVSATADESKVNFETSVTRQIEPVSTEQISQQSPKTEEELAKILKETFIIDSDDALQCDITTVISNNIFEFSEPSSQNIWNNLQTIDVQTFGFIEKWKESESFRLLLNALKIDKRLIMSHENFFGLGPILQPTPSSAIIAGPSQLIPTTSNSKKAHESTRVCNYLPVLSNASDISSTNIKNTNLNHQDLDFFELKYSQSNSRQFNENKTDLISELEDIILNVKEEQSNTEKVSQSNSPSVLPGNINEMLKASATNQVQVLSAEALQILSELPKLSFMRANVLMFPMKPETEDTTIN